METTCFACRPGFGVGSGARALCPRHKQACELSDGSMLSERLASVTPNDGQLEGSSLGWLYNPVSVVDDQGHRRRAWTSFVGGGMAVLEDRFGAADPFEFWMCERDDMTALLATIRKAGDAGEVRTFMRSLPQPSQEAFGLALSMWLWHRQVSERYRALGRWPQSFEELSRVLESADVTEALEQTELPHFVEHLAQLAHKRLSGPHAPA